MLLDMMTYPCGSRVLLWRLDEEASQLLALCCQEGIPVDDLAGLPVKRQREKAAERLLLCRAFGKPVPLAHTRQGAPYVEGRNVNISISHTMHLVALAWNEQEVIGLDAEQLDRKQVIKVRDKFLNTSEQQFISPDNQTAHVIAWTAKEAVIKAERNSALNWTDGICLQPFTPVDHETALRACCADHRYRLTARLVEGHCVTLAVPAVD